MITQTRLRMTRKTYNKLKNHLYPGDGKESVSIALCGTSELEEDNVVSKVVCVHRVVNIPYKDCTERTETKVQWKTDILPTLLEEANINNQRLLKIHSHPTGCGTFSSFDNDADKELFAGVSSWLGKEDPGVSAIMLPDGNIVARTVDGYGNFTDVYSVCIVGPDIQFWYSDSPQGKTPEHAIRTAQTFGNRTTALLSHLSVGVVGASGTGSPTIEMLYRLGVGKLVIVDDDVVEQVNVGRILNSTMDDALRNMPKVNVLEKAIKRSGLPTKVVAIPKDTFNPDVVKQLAQCDILFGCIDTIEGRELLNRLSSFYIVPYFDLGVKLEADGKGGVQQVCGTVHYLQPGGSSLLSRGVFTSEELSTASLRRTDREEYQKQVEEKYIRGAQVDSPAVISVNTLIASLGVNDFLARIHPFRDDSNSEFSALRISLTQSRLICESEGPPDEMYRKFVGKGDVTPLLELPCLSK